MPRKTIIEAVRDALHEEMARDERVIVLGEDVGIQGGVFRATDGLLERFGPKRVIDTPLAEAAIVGVAIGMSLNDLIPVAEIQFADFIYPGFDQIVSEAAKMRYRSVGGWNCPLVIRTPWGGGVHGGLYHSQSIEAFFAHVAGLKVVAPATAADAKGLLKTAIRDPDPVIFLEHKKTYRAYPEEVPDGDLAIPFGKAAVRRQGRDVTAIAYGLMLHYCLEAANEVARENVDVEVIDLRTLRPLDKETVLESVKKTSKVLIVYEDNLTGGFGGELAGIIGQEAFEYLDGPITRLAGPDVPAIGFGSAYEQEYMPTPRKIADALRQLAAY